MFFTVKTSYEYRKSVCITTGYICACVCVCGFLQNDAAKPEEPVKTPVKEEEEEEDESLNIQNSLMPKVENNTDSRISADEPEEVNSLKNVV